MDQLKAPGSLNLDGNLSENWRRWKQRFEIYLDASGIVSKTEKVKTSTLLHTIGEEALEIYNSFVFETPENRLRLIPVLEKFEEYCSPKRNVTYERHIFNIRSQKVGESFDQYFSDLRNKAKNCEFGELCDSLIRDRIVCGILSDQLRTRLLRESDLTLEKAVNICRANELSLNQAKSLGSEHSTDVHEVSRRVNKSRPYQQSKSPQNERFQYKFRPELNRDTKQKFNTYKSPISNTARDYQQYYRCYRCGGNHSKQNQCPAFGSTCSFCGLANHWAKACRKKNYNRHQKRQVHSYGIDDGDDMDSFFIGSVETANITESKWYVTLNINDTLVKFKLDTGAECNVIPKSLFDKLAKGSLSKSKVKLNAFGGHQLTSLGRGVFVCQYKQKYHVLEFQVVESDVPYILGLKSCVELGLVQRIYDITNKPDVPLNNCEKLLHEYSDVFDGLGCIKDIKHHIVTDPAVNPVMHPARRVPVAIRPKIKDELDRM
ncbi:hypothetical protein SNE40_022164 [Patella caerulea]|uniref:Peptidase A2 domain-containing protein n=1 Tax=Patella caerulea TaxID=87958 RepID=A0AAN8J471_PATCE